MEAISEVLKDSKKIVVKIGSNVLSNNDGAVNKEIMHNIVEQVSEMIELGKQVIIVSSGAGICGVGAINKWSRRGDMNYKQTLQAGTFCRYRCAAALSICNRHTKYRRRGV